MLLRRSLWVLAGGLLLWPLGASAIEFPLPSVDTRLHTPNSAQPGAEWDTGPAGGDEITYTASTTTLHLDAELFTLNYYDPNIGACPTDVGSNCAHNYTTNLDISLDAMLDSVTVTSIGFGFYSIEVAFETTGGTDITVTDVSGPSTTVLTAEWAAGTFNGDPTTGLTAFATYNDGSFFGSPGLTGDPTIVGFALITGGVYAQLFDSGLAGSDFGVQIGEIFESAPGALDALAAYIVANSSLPDFAFEAEGQVFRLEAGEFELPEPGAALLLAPALLLALRRRRS